jgi:hypothetical protein
MALRTVLDEVRAGDPLAPVEVIVPTGIAGVTVRRAVAGEAGLANVRFSALPPYVSEAPVVRLPRIR